VAKDDVDSEELLGLGFTNEWLNMGIISREGVHQIVASGALSEDPHPEHYRWRAFQSFLASRPVLDADTARALFELGENDQDLTMGGSMKAEILRRKDCPITLLEEAANSDVPFLAKIARERLESSW
jgi:hypothetical protein